MRIRLTVGGVAALAAAAGAQQAGVVNTPSSPPPMMVTNSSPPQMQVMSAIGVPPAAPLPPGARIVRPPELRSTVSSYITPDHYRARARAAKPHGRVEFEVTGGPNGRVAGCSCRELG